MAAAQVSREHRLGLAQIPSLVLARCVASVKPLNLSEPCLFTRMQG